MITGTEPGQCPECGRDSEAWRREDGTLEHWLCNECGRIKASQLDDEPADYPAI